MRGQQLLLLEAALEAFSALMLLAFPRFTCGAAGLPTEPAAFWPRYVGALVAGLAVATALELLGWTDQGLGLAGHAAINLVMSFFLISHLMVGPPLPTTRATLALWGFALFLAGLGFAEIGHL